MKILHKSNNSTGTVPNSSNLDTREIAINTADGLLFIKKDNGEIVTIPSNKTVLYKTITVDAINNPIIADDIDVVFFSDSTLLGGQITIPSPVDGKQIKLVPIDSNILTKDTTIIASGGSNVNGQSSAITRKILYAATTFLSDGTEWYGSSGQSLSV